MTLFPTFDYDHIHTLACRLDNDAYEARDGGDIEMARGIWREVNVLTDILNALPAPEYVPPAPL